MNLRPGFTTRSERVSTQAKRVADAVTPPVRRGWRLRRATKAAEKDANKAVSRLSRLQLKSAALKAKQQAKIATAEANQAALQRLTMAAQHEADQALARLSQLRLGRATLSVEKEAGRSAAKIARSLRSNGAAAKVGPGAAMLAAKVGSSLPLKRAKKAAPGPAMLAAKIGSSLPLGRNKKSTPVPAMLAAKIGSALHLKSTTRKAERGVASLASTIGSLPVERTARTAGKRIEKFASNLGRRMELKRVQRDLYRAVDSNALARRVLGRRAARRTIPRPLLIAVPVVAAGAGLAYLLNSEMGSSRRDAIREWSREAWHGVREFMPEAIGDLRRRSQDTLTRLSGGEVPDDVLAERVRSALRFAVSYPRPIEVDARGGYIVLTGPVLAADVDRLLQRIGEVPGVVSIENRLESHLEAGDVPGLQGPVAAITGDTQDDNWSPGIRLLATVAGTTVAATSLSRSGPARIVGAIVGLLLALRGITNVRLTQMSSMRPSAQEY